MRRLGGALGVAIALACASARGQNELPNPVSHPGAPWAYAGFIVNAPEGQGWLSQFKNARGSAVGKLRAPNHTYALTVRLFSVPPNLDAEKLAGYLKEHRGKLTDLHRFDVLSHGEEPASHAGQPCSRYRVAAHDKGVLAYAPLPLIMTGLTCIHPGKTDLAADVGYSERGGSQRFSADLADAGERMVASLRSFPLGPRPQIGRALELMRGGDMEGVKRELAPLADSGDRFAAMRLGEFLLRSPSADDHALARKYLEDAAADGHPDALFNMGAAYDKALGGPRDLEKAVHWFGRAADQRDAEAQFNLGVLHHPRGNGAVKDIDIANRWLRMAADNGHQPARQLLGR